MLFMVRPDTKSVHLLADLLETIEVTADELMDQRLAPLETSGGPEDGDTVVQNRLAALRQFVRSVRDLELSLLSKLEQARGRARTVARSDWRLRPIMSMFTSGTQALADHIASPQGRAAMRFDGGGEAYPFLRSRELLAPMAEQYDGAGELLVTDSFRLLGLIKLRDLLERCEVALNALDAHYDLYEWPSEDAPDLEETVTVAEVAAASTPDLAEAQAAIVAITAAVVTSVGPDATKAEEALAEAEPTNWGISIAALEGPAATIPAPVDAETETPSLATTGEPPATEPPAAEQTTPVEANLPQTEPLPTAEEIAIAEAASEDGLKSLTERLWELKAADATVATPEPAKSDAA